MAASRRSFAFSPRELPELAEAGSLGSRYACGLAAWLPEWRELRVPRPHQDRQAGEVDDLHLKAEARHVELGSAAADVEDRSRR